MTVLFIDLFLLKKKNIENRFEKWEPSSCIGTVTVTEFLHLSAAVSPAADVTATAVTGAATLSAHQPTGQSDPVAVPTVDGRVTLTKPPGFLPFHFLTGTVSFLVVAKDEGLL